MKSTKGSLSICGTSLPLRDAILSFGSLLSSLQSFNLLFSLVRLGFNVFHLLGLKCPGEIEFMLPTVKENEDETL